MHEDLCQSCRFLHDPIHRALSCLTSERMPERIFITSRPMLERIYILYQTSYVQDWLLSNVKKHVRKNLIVYQISTYVICLTSVESYRVLDFYVHDLSNIRQILSCTRSTYAICLTSEVLNVDLTRLASDLGWTRQKYYRTVHKYTCTVHNQAAYDTRPHKRRISMGSMRKKTIQVTQASRWPTSGLVDKHMRVHTYEFVCDRSIIR